ncbi:hypothetical protein [Mechercharimyces sp. CAU 1602]|uniref:hypothetical protein n=1 Tax=Mechercharimyces sp. CAU 1602 TaxID=2973933 RepID=UPI002162E083|nr:hypothetical protein [Mechercharimyces sp. CAU 1602]MCS1351663.1 hypothetical protein [Mechercharimyces sp. CAU 1602]
MRKLIVMIILISCLIFTSACTIGDPVNYYVFIFKGNGGQWSAEIEYIDLPTSEAKEDQVPKDVLNLKYKGNESDQDKKATFKIEGTDISGEIMLEKGKGKGTIGHKLVPLVESITLEEQDSRIVDPIVLEVELEGHQSEKIELYYHTAYRQDAREILGD